MVELRSLYRLAERRRIEVYPFPLPETGSLSVQDEAGRCYIGIDSGRAFTTSQERTHLAHELGHCVTGSFYSRYTKIDSRQRHENRADKWAVRKLISRGALDDAVADGCTELWELAERFGVSEELMKKAVCYYTYGNVAAELYF